MNRFLILLPALATGLAVLFFGYITWLYHLNCFHYYDFGIAAEAIQKIRILDLNPFIPGINFRIFCNHFDPAYALGSPLSWFIPAPIFGIALEFISVLGCWFPMQLLYRKGKITQLTSYFAFAFLVLNHATVTAWSYPIHPTTWAILPMVCSFTFYLLKDRWKLIASLLFLFACKEEFPFFGLLLGALLIFERENKTGFWVTSISLVWGLFALILRSKMCVASIAHGTDLLGNFAKYPLSLLENFSPHNFKFWILRLLPLVFVLPFSEFKNHKINFFKMIFVGLSVLSIRFIAVKWEFHYGTAAVVIILFALLPLLNAGLQSSLITPLRKGLACFFLFLFGITYMIKNDIHFFARSMCIPSHERIEAIKEAQNWIRSSHKTKLLTEGNLATQILVMSPEKEIHFIADPFNDKGGPFEVVFVEKPPSGDPWPIDYSRIASLIEIWKKNPLIHIIFDNHSIFLAEGIIEIDR